MQKNKLLLLLSVLILFLLAFLLLPPILTYKQPVTKLQSNVFQAPDGSNINSGKIFRTDNELSANIVATLYAVTSRNGDVFAEFKAGEIIYKINIYSKDIGFTTLRKQTTNKLDPLSEFYKDYVIENSNDALKSLKENIGSDVIFQVWLQGSEGISKLNNRILKCNSDLISSIESLQPLKSNCQPVSFLTS